MVSTTQGEPLGKITEVFTTEGNDTYVANGDRGEILIPAIEDVVKSIDLEQGRMVIDPIEGLLSLNQKATD
jgi:16S rRNA processing protein RimM